MNMPLLSRVFGILFIALGLGCYYAIGGGAKTALIPAYFGVILVICGWIASAAPKLRMHVMHVAALVGLLGVAGGLGMSLRKVIALLSGGEAAAAVARPFAVWEQFSFGLLSLVFVALCVKSFIDARRARKG
jgi:hypothetical protein